eukprot:SAG11_NODE_27776_length_329_cov_0.660870_1_plen_46_part_01
MFVVVIATVWRRYLHNVEETAGHAARQVVVGDPVAGVGCLAVGIVR